MAGDTTYGMLKRISYLPANERPAEYDGGTIIAGQDVDNVLFLGGDISGVTIHDLGVPLPIADGGTGQITANLALNALLPSQATHANQVLKTDGTNTSWSADIDTGITQLTGDVTAGPGNGSQVATLATITSANTAGSASSVAVVTKDVKGRVTGNVDTAIQIAESQVTNLVSDLALKAPLASPTFTGTVTLPVGLTGPLKAASGVVSASAINLASEVTGDLPFANLTQGAALTVLANATNGTADFAALAAASDNQVLRRSGTALAFGTVNLASTNAVTGDLPFSNLAQVSANSFLGNNTGSTADAVALTVAQSQVLLSYPPILGGFTTVNFNSANTDFPITVVSPTTLWRLTTIYVINTGTTASLTTARAGLFTAPTGGGTAISVDAALSAINSNTAGTAVNSIFATQSVASTTYFSGTSTTLYYRVSTAQGAAASGSVYIFIQPLP